MSMLTRSWATVCFLATGWVCSGCDQQAPAPKAPQKAAEVPSVEATNVEARPSSMDDRRTAEHKGLSEPGTALQLSGLSMTVPDDWERQSVTPGPMAPKAIFRLAGAGSDEGACTVRITHFPGMKGMDDANIARWIGQVRRADGTPATRDDAEITIENMGSVRLTVVDLAGSLSTSMGPGGKSHPNQRLIAAIVDHPQGPHFVKASGGAAAMAKWESSVKQFLKSARTK